MKHFLLIPFALIAEALATLKSGFFLSRSVIRVYLWRLLVAVDQFANAVLGGDPDMTISGRMGRAIKEGRCRLCRPVCWFLGLIDPDHCTKQDRSEADEGKDETIKL